MQNLLDSNLSLLSTYDAGLADRLRFHMPSGGVERFATPQNFASLRVIKGGEAKLIHSGQDPVREAERWVGTLDLESPYNLLVFGSGLFYHVYQLVKRMQSTLRELTIVEKEIDVVHTLFSSIDLANFLRNKNTYFLIDPGPAEIRSFMNQHITAFTLDGLSIVEHPASCALHPEFYRETRAVIQECLQGGEMLLRTKVHLGGIIQENIIRNVPYLLSQPLVSSFKGMFPNVPAFVIGAGPSLDLNMDRLAEIGDRGIIIAADTVLKPLRSRGIHPHIVVTTDPTELNAHHFLDIDDLGETILVFSPSVNHRIPKQLKGTKTVIPLQTSRLMNLFPQVQRESNSLRTGVNVGQTCFNLAHYMGCSPIILAGLDFSFPVEGGFTHASGTALKRRIYATDSPGKMRVELLDEFRSLEEFEPVYIPGSVIEKVATNKFWLSYLRSMEQEIANTGKPVFNCTEGGARIEGALARSLGEVIRETCVRNVQARMNLQAVVGFFFGEPMTEGITILEEGVQILQTAVSFSDEGLRELSALETVANSLSPHREIILEKLRAVTDCHKKLIQDHKVYIILDEAADAILQPFLRQDSRPSGDPASLENVKTSIERYRPYFEGMKRICEQYQSIARETINAMKSGEFDFSASFL
jgi:hypothetical protein